MVVYRSRFKLVIQYLLEQLPAIYKSTTQQDLFDGTHTIEYSALDSLYIYIERERESIYTIDGKLHSDLLD
jgi:hypothetical protein